MSRAATALAMLLGTCCSREPAATSGDLTLPSGIVLQVHRLGRGPDTVLVLPGGPAFGSRYLQEALAPLADRHTLLFLDPRGRGESPAVPADSLSMAADLRDLDAVREQLQLQRATLIGHHWGAAVAMLYAAAHPGDVGRLALIGPMPDGITTIYELTRVPHDSLALTRHAKALQAEMPRLDPDRYCRDFWGFALSPAEEVDPAVVTGVGPAVCNAPLTRLQEWTPMAQALYGSLGGWEWRDTMRLVSAPTLVITGTRNVPRREVARLWATHVVDGRLLVLDASPAFPWVEDRRAFLRDLGQFLDGAWPAKALPEAPATTVSAVGRD